MDGPTSSGGHVPVAVMPAAVSDRGRISKNFWFYEFDCRDGTPVPQDKEDAVRAFVERNLQPLRDFLDCKLYISSAYRTPQYNKAVGGASNSYHLYDKGDAIATDIRVVGIDPPVVKVIIEGLINLGIMEEGGLGLYKNFVHYDNRGYRARW